MTTRTRFFLAALLAAVCPALADAQTVSLRIDSVDIAAFPTVKLHAVTKQDLLLRKDLAASNYTVREDGVPQTPLAYFGTRGTRPFSVALLLAAGSTVSASEFISEKGIAERVLDSLDGITDEGSIISYAAVGTVAADWSAAVPLLKNALAGMSVGTGSNHFWNGLYTAVQSTINTVNVRCVLVIANGRDDGSNRTRDDVVTLANQMNVPIYVVPVNPSDLTDMTYIANQTGGKLIQNPDLAVQTVVNDMRQTPEYCILQYTSNNACRDGSARTLDVAVTLAGSNANAAAQYQPAADAATNVAATFAVDTASIASGGSGTVGLLQQTVLANQRLYAGTVALSFDTALLTLTGVAVDTTYAKGCTASFSGTASGAQITLGGIAVLQGKGRVLRLTFAATDVTQNTTVPVDISDIQFTRGCLLPQMAGGRVTIRPKTASVTGTATALSFVWDDAKKDYDPPTAELRLEVTNNGSLPLTALSATMPLTAGLRFVLGSQTLAPVAPATLQPGQKGIASWFIRPEPRADEKAFQLDLAISAAELTAPRAVRAYVSVKAATSAVLLGCDADTVRVSGGTHAPDPAGLRATVLSAGSAAGPAGSVALQLPAGLALAGGTADQSFPSLPSGQSQTLAWSVTYPKTLAADSVFIVRWVMTPTGAPPDTIELPFTVPGLTSAVLAGSCTVVPDTVVYDTVARKYADITVTGTVTNSGSGASGAVTATIAIAPGLILGPGETALKSVSASLAPSASADVHWTLRIAGTACGERQAAIDVAFNETNGPIGSCHNIVTILARPNLPPEITGKSPAVLDTVYLDTDQDFSVTATDANGDALTYSWLVDGTDGGSTTNALRTSFSVIGSHTVSCIVRDLCDSVTVTWTFRVEQKTGIAGTPAAADFGILGAYPNPFNPSTTLRVVLPGAADVLVDLVSPQGRVLRSIAVGRLAAGVHELPLDAGALPSGLYFARLRAAGRVSVRAVLLQK